MNHSQINLVMALPCEAKPLIRYYRLKKNYAVHAFSLFSNHDQSINLIVAGIGKVKTAAAVGFLHQYIGAKSNASYLNIGIAGGAQYQVGDFVIAQKIIDHESKRVLYPSLIHFTHLTKATVVSASVPMHIDNAVVDMEAYAFFAATSLFVDQELVHCVKIVSDTHLQETKQITALSAESLIQAGLTKIDNVIQQLQSLSIQESTLLSMLSFSHEFKVHWHFSHYQTNQLQELLRRWSVTLPQEDALAYCATASTARVVLGMLNDRLNAVGCEW